MAQTLHKGDFIYLQQCLLVSRKPTAVLQNLSGKSQVAPDPFSSINRSEAALSGLLNRDTLPNHCGKAPKTTFLLILLTVQKKSDFFFPVLQQLWCLHKLFSDTKACSGCFFLFFFFSLCPFTCMLCCVVLLGINRISCVVADLQSYSLMDLPTL